MCFAGIESLLIWIVLIVAIVAIVRVVLNYAPGIPILAIQIANILLWAAVAIACIYIVFELFTCLLPLPRMH